MTLQARIEAAITSSTHQKAEFSDSKTVYGGCINDSWIVTLKDSGIDPINGYIYVGTK